MKGQISVIAGRGSSKESYLIRQRTADARWSVARGGMRIHIYKQANAPVGMSTRRTSRYPLDGGGVPRSVEQTPSALPRNPSTPLEPSIYCTVQPPSKNPGAIKLRYVRVNFQSRLLPSVTVAMRRLSASLFDNSLQASMHGCPSRTKVASSEISPQPTRS